MDNAEYRDLVLGIYQAVSDPDEWRQVFDRVTELVSARGCMLLEWNVGPNGRTLEIPLMSSTYDPALVQKYFDKYRKWEAEDHDTFDTRLMGYDGIDMLSEEILYDDRDEYNSRPHVKELTALGIRHRTGALLDKDNPFRSRFSLSMGKERGPFTGEEVKLLRDLLPHMAKALDLSRPAGTPGADHSALLAIMDRLNVGICLLDPQGRVAAKNTEFDRQTDEYGGFSRDGHGRLRMSDTDDQALFAEMLDDALNHGRFGARPRKEAILVETEETGSALCVEIVPVERSKEIGSQAFGGAWVISRDTGREIDIDIDLAKRVFELTNTESAVVGLVCDGLTNAEIADQRERSVETVNAQMKSILGKTRAGNRTQLVRLLCNFSLPGSYFRR